eukprot:TRINITY_DN1499_c3_g1_i1.p1 TRINITY_DN1499_c3_g1~~TRINITY_DN1499_c3_g1_i1.p1  ORF type:complete len:201 (+),score=101.40 TRINITY_DN1499_c3_g1_i1:134-736(+)
MDVDYDFLLKFIVIGDAATGKTSILRRFVDNKFIADSNHTVGVEFFSKIIEVEASKLKLQLWDTAGQERFRAITRGYYRSTVGVLLVYDISSRESFNRCGSWLNEARSLAEPNAVYMLIGNKSDLSVQREVTFEEASRFAEENSMMFIETSAKSNTNVSEVFYQLASQIKASGIPGPSKAKARDTTIIRDPPVDQGQCSC